MAEDREIDIAVVTAAVFEAIADTAAVPLAKIAPDRALEKDLGIDSLDFVRLIQDVEEHLDIVLTDEMAVGVVTVADLVVIAVAAVRAKESSETA